MKANYEKNNEKQELILNKYPTFLSDKDLNEVIGEIVIGYGNDMINIPPNASNGYIINIPHSSLEVSKLYNKQFYINRIDTKTWERHQENGVWSEWTRII